MNITHQIKYWAHMLDESRHASYYDVYMQENPSDKLPSLIESLISEFVSSLRKDHIKLDSCLSNGLVNYAKVEELQKKIKTKYVWEKIKASTYAAIITRLTALLSKSQNQRFNESDEIQFDDVSRLISRRTIEKCLDIICHNTNVLLANNHITQINANSHEFDHIFEKYGLHKQKRKSYQYGEVEDYFVVEQLYKAWASYAKGVAGEHYVCDSDNGPADLIKILSSVEYSADTIDLIVTLNKSLDVVHFRSDLALAFIEGGQQTCALVSNLPDKFVV